MTKKHLILSAILLAGAGFQAFGWSQKGHDTTAHIAERHLTKATADSVASLLDGMSLVYWANWLDNASHTPDYSYTKTWHYKNVDEGTAYEDAPLNPDGDAVVAIRGQIAILRDPGATRSRKALALKILSHITGDLHQPMHMGHATDYGGNTIKVKFFNSELDLHSVWDNDLPEAAHKWSYTEWADQMDRVSPESEALIVAGTVDDWAKETLGIANRVYELTPKGSHLSYNEIAYWTPVIEQQFLRGGLRLAYMLNSIFDPGFQGKTTSF